MAKKQQIIRMFDSISGSYDFINHLLSLGIDIYWRKRAIKFLRKFSPKNILDIATGTGDFAIEAIKLNPERIIGVDISEKMLANARKKINKLHLENKIKFLLADCEKLPFEDDSFDAIIVGFGVRNFENLSKGLLEMYRALDKNGTVIILEFSKPKAFLIKNIFNFYFKNILPFVGRLISKDEKAYSYLPQSVENFPEGKDFLKILDQSGFNSLKQIKLTFGIASIYIGEK